MLTLDLWNDYPRLVIVFGYSFGGQMGVAASKYVAADRIVFTSAPNVPIDSPWLKQPNKTPPSRCYFLGGVKDGEQGTHLEGTALLGNPVNHGMVDWDRMCEFMFHTQK